MIVPPLGNKLKWVTIRHYSGILGGRLKRTLILPNVKTLFLGFVGLLGNIEGMGKWLKFAALMASANPLLFFSLFLSYGF